MLCDMLRLMKSKKLMEKKDMNVRERERERVFVVVAGCVEEQTQHSLFVACVLLRWMRATYKSGKVLSLSFSL